MTAKATRDRLYARTDAELARDLLALWPSGLAPCRFCHRELPFSAFGVYRHLPRILNKACKQCLADHKETPAHA